MYNQVNQMINIDRQIEDLQRLKQAYQNMPQQPINNIINTNQRVNANNSLIEWRILNEKEEVDNLFVQNKTLFVGDKNMVLKDIDGRLEKWEIKKIYPVDPKDERISELEKQIQELKGMINNEHTNNNQPSSEFIEPRTNDNVNDEPSTKRVSKSISK